jgi:hypothetical protein
VAVTALNKKWFLFERFTFCGKQGVQVVHEPWEEYVGEMCEGITSKLYGTHPSVSLSSYVLTWKWLFTFPVPPSSALDATLAPFLPPGVLQAQIEGTVALYEGLNPAFWPADCRLARRAYMCGAYFRCVAKRTFLRHCASLCYRCFVSLQLSARRRLAGDVFWHCVHAVVHAPRSVRPLRQPVPADDRGAPSAVRSRPP